MNLFCDSKMDDAQRRAELYRGSIFVYSASPSGQRFAAFARGLIEASFSGLDPERAQEHMPVEKCVEVLAGLKPKFIHHSESKQLVRELLAEHGCDLEKTYFDVPRLRTAFPSEYLSSGIAYAFHPHRDTWYSAPFSQINWWMPVFEVRPENGMAFHPKYWYEKIPNSSNTYNYYEWNRTSRQSASQHIKADTRVQPRSLVDIEREPELRVIPGVGGIMLFSAAHLHSTVQNTCGVTRYSIDFRTVHLDDVWGKCGAPNIDSASSGTTMEDYISAADLGKLPSDAIALYLDGTESECAASTSVRT